MKKYCFDTSGISNPLETMPEDIHDWLWRRVRILIEVGAIAVTREIYDEMVHIPGMVGDCIKGNRDHMVLEVGDKGWNWELYVDHVRALQITYQEFISEFSGGLREPSA